MADEHQEEKGPLLPRLLKTLIRWTLLAIIVVAIGIIIYGLLPEDQQQQVRDLHEDLHQEIDETVKPKAKEAVEKIKSLGAESESAD